jgi:hypothetical protein
LGKDALQARTEQGGIDRTVDVLDPRNLHTATAGPRLRGRFGRV